MTEAGERWLCDYIREHEPIPEYGDMVGAMKYSIRAFCDEVVKLAKACKDTHRGITEIIPAACLTKAFDDLKRELLGDDHA